MSATLHHRSAEVFIAALDIDPRDRQIFINEQCAGNEAIKAEVEALLRADEEAKSFLAPPRRPAAAEDDFTLTKNLVGKRIGGYHVTRWIASGGMGSIYEAIQESLGRTVALKVLKHGVVDAKSLRRFEYEAQLLARLRHPGIAQILEAGFFEDCEGWLGASGTRAPYFAMEFVPEAVTITDYVHDHHLDVPRRLKLIAAVCDAVHHGHLCGITHRDLKPANILVMNNAQDLPQPKIIDFGVARAARTEGGLTTMQTAVGQLVGTLAYMSPEQCAADPDDIDIRSDIYSLGVVLYEVLCGRLPYVVPAANPLEAVRVVQQKPPSKLSSIDPALRGDLEAIVFKALEKDRSRRYQSAEGLAKDLRRFIHHEPVSARAPSVMYQLRYFARRNKPLMAGVVSAFVLLVAGVLATSWGLVRARRAERIADVRRAAAEREAYLANIAAADSAIAAMDGGGALARLQETPVTQRGWEWYHLASRADRSRFQLDGPISPVRMASSRGGKSIIGVFDDGSVSRWDVADRRIRWSVANAFPRNTDSSSGVVCVAPNARRFAVIVQSDVWIFDADNGKKLGSLPITSSHREALNIAFHPDGRHLAVSTTRDASLWNVDTALEEHVVDLAGYVFGIAFSADGRLLAHSDREGVTLRNSLTFDYVDRLPIQFGASYLQFSPDGASLAACNGSTVTILDIASHRV
ncbi:MAG TPA: WD40 repeat domain-containing serine/threonine protein kinase, partial [Phycisphaerae bacterium]|nr:WD40 repeat domain-containing serine/threonine protein kinase [Phycisphaerae bacterium]